MDLQTKSKILTAQQVMLLDILSKKTMDHTLVWDVVSKTKESSVSKMSKYTTKHYDLYFEYTNGNVYISVTMANKGTAKETGLQCALWRNQSPEQFDTLTSLIRVGSYGSSEDVTDALNLIIRDLITY